MFRAHVLIIRRSTFHYTASGIITPIGGRLVPLSTCAPDGHLQVWWYQTLYNSILTYWWWAHVLETCRGMKYGCDDTRCCIIQFWPPDEWAHAFETCRGMKYGCDDTRCCIVQFWPPDDEHMGSKHVEAWNKTYCETKILCIKLVNYCDKHPLPCSEKYTTGEYSTTSRMNSAHTRTNCYLGLFIPRTKSLV